MRAYGRLVRILLVALAICGCIETAGASQIANHSRIAHLAWEDPATPALIKELLIRNFDAYLAGAAGPDVFTNLVGQYDELLHTPHYNRTGQLIRHMLDIAYLQPDLRTRERYVAYTLGWITHYYLDIHEHKLVNRYGGYYKIDATRHKSLEMFETAHVFATAEHPSLPYVPRAGGLPAELVTEALYRTFPKSLVDRLLDSSTVAAMRDAGLTGDIMTAANVMEQFVLIGIDAYRNQRRVGTAQELAMGQIPFRSEYAALLNPLDLAITKFVIDPRVRPGDSRSIFAELSWSLRDDGLALCYITDWYQSNADALSAIVGTFRAVEGSLWRTPVSLPDYDLDTGDPEGNDGAAVSAAQAFRRAEAVDIAWEVLSAGGRKLVEGSQAFYLSEHPPDSQTAYSRPRNGKQAIIYVPADPSLFYAQNQKLTLRATIRLVNNNRQLMPGRHVSAFRFGSPDAAADPGGRRRVVIEATDEWRSAIDMPRLTEAPGPQPLPSCDADVAEARRGVEELRGRAAAAAGGLATVQAARAEAEALRASAESLRAEARSMASGPQADATACARLRSGVADLVSRMDWAEAQLAVREEKASALATIACELASEALRTQDAAEAARHRQGAAGFAKQAALAAAEADQIVADAAGRVAAGFGLRAEIEALAAPVSAPAAGVRDRRDRLAAALAALDPRARAALASIEDAAAASASSGAAIESGRERCPDLEALRTQLTAIRQQLVGPRNLAIGEMEALDRAVAEAQAALADVAATLESPERTSGCDGLDALKSALEGAVQQNASFAAVAARARDAARRADECARGTAAPTSLVRPDPGAGAPPPDPVAPEPSAPPVQPDQAPSGAGNPWDQAVQERPPETQGVNPWDEAVRSAAQPEASPAGTPPGVPPGGGGPVAPGSPGPDVGGLIAAAAALGDPPSCNYEAALAQLAAARQIDSADPRIGQLQSRIEALRAAQAQALAYFRQAQGLLAANDLAGARAAAVAAQSVGSPCDRTTAVDLIALIDNSTIRGQVAADRQRAAQQSQEAAAAILGTLIAIRDAAAAAQGGAPPPPAAPPPPSGPGVASGRPSTSTYCSITMAGGAADGDGDLYWALIGMPATPQVTNYLVIPFREGSITPDEWVRQAGLQSGGRGAGPARVLSRGTRATVEASARQYCPNPTTAPPGLVPLVPR